MTKTLVEFEFKDKASFSIKLYVDAQAGLKAANPFTVMGAAV